VELNLALGTRYDYDLNLEFVGLDPGALVIELSR